MKRNQMNRAKVSTHIFNFRLYLEGLKRLRVVGLASAILAITASALVPIDVWLSGGVVHDGFLYIDTEYLCAPAGLMTVLAPLFFAVLFSFLQKRKESDFFHAIPYTRTCVYVSFVAAALSFIWAIQIACGLVAVILWAMVPYAVFDLGGLISYVLLSLLSAAMLSAFMMLALTVSGTPGSCAILFLLFASFVRVLAAIFLGMLESVYLLPVSEMWHSSVLAPAWFLPIAVVGYIFDPDSMAGIMYSPANIVYSLTVTLLLYALAGVIYKHRRSEMAGNAAPSVRLQTLFRCMFTSMLALVIPMYGILDVVPEISILVVLVVAVLLVYFLYELITTKRPKNMIKAIPGLGIVAAVCVVFTLGFYAYRAAVLYEDIEADEIQSVSVNNCGIAPYSYQGLIIGNACTCDGEVISTVADRLAATQTAEINHHTFYDDETRSVTVTIRTKSGRTLRRRIRFSPDQLEDFLLKCMETYEIRDAFYELPAAHTVTSAIVRIGDNSFNASFYRYDFTSKLYEVFSEEYASLTKEQKAAIMAPTLKFGTYETPDFELSINGVVKNNYYDSDYAIGDFMPRTRAYMVYMLAFGHESYYTKYGESQSGPFFRVITDALKDLDDPVLAGDGVLFKVNLTVTNASDGESHDGQAYINSAQAKQILTLLSERETASDFIEPDDFHVNENTRLVDIDVSLYNSDVGFYALELTGVYELTDEDMQLIRDCLTKTP